MRRHCCWEAISSEEAQEVWEECTIWDVTEETLRYTAGPEWSKVAALLLDT